MVDSFNWSQVGECSTGFGVSTSSVNPWLTDPSPYHPGGPNGLYFDGHVDTITPPATDNRYALRKMFTANFSGVIE
jgi:prepilin-type processing-associated H-X9-DG protein